MQPNIQANNQIHITKQVVRNKTEKGKFLNQYKKIKKIGQGPFAKIKLMIDSKTGRQYAMKKFNMFILRKKIKMSAKNGGQTKYTTQADEVVHEIEIMKKLNHPNIVRLYEIIEDDEQQKIYLIMDYCKYGDIAQWDHKKQIFKCIWPMKQIAKFFKQAALGLQYMHSINIIHRDIKPQNILVAENKTAKLIDFGRSVQLADTEQKIAGSEGTYHFMAPQTLSQKIKGGFDGKKSDIWSLGVSLFSVVFGIIPFNAQFLVKLFQKIQNADYSFPTKMTDEQHKFVPIIKQILNLDWNKRPSIRQVAEKLEKIENSL